MASKTIGVVLSLKDKFSSPLKDVAKKVGKTEQELKKANLQIRKFEQDSIRGFKKASLVIAGASAALTGLGAIITKTTIDYAKEVKQMQRLTGASVEEASKMVVVGKRYGVSAEQMSKSLRMLAIKAKNGSKDFKAYGLSVKDTNGKLLPASKILENVADKYKQLGGGLEGAVFAQKLMGKSAMGLVPILAKGSAGIREMESSAQRMGLILTKDNMVAFEKFNQAQKIFNQVMLGIQVTIGVKLLPALSRLGEKFQVVAQQIDFKQIGAVAKSAFDGISSATIFLSHNLNWLIPIATGVLGTILAFKTISGVLTTIRNLAIVIDAVKTAQLAWNIQLTATNVLMDALGWGILIATISAVVMNFDKLRNAAERAGGAIKHALHISGGATGTWGDSDTKTLAKKPSGHALGTNYFSGGATRINEGGRGEVVNLPSGSQIIPHDLSKKVINQSGRGDITVIIQGDFIGTHEMFNKFKNMLASEFHGKLATT